MKDDRKLDKIIDFFMKESPREAVNFRLIIKYLIFQITVYKIWEY